MSQLHRGLKLCPYSTPLLQGLFFDPKIKAPEEHSQLKIFLLSYIYKKIGTELRKFFHQDSPYYKVHPGCGLYPIWHTGLPALAGHPTYHVNVIKLK